MFELFEQSAFDTSRGITNLYSSSFGKGISALDKKYQKPIYGIYGFVRYADEIVDTFYGFDQKLLMEEFDQETKKAISRKISLNPVLHAFQQVVHQYNIDVELIDAFISSMKMDLDMKQYDEAVYSQYIFGSAEVVGLMCLKVFVEGDEALNARLIPYARSLGAAFQKINFLRDVQSDYEDRGRTYFPGIDFNSFSEEEKRKIEADIEEDFNRALIGIRQLPDGARKGVYLAFVYYKKLLSRIKKVSAHSILKQRIRVPDNEKLLLQAELFLKFKLNLL